MFDGFRLEMLDLGEIRVRVRIGGDGPPLLLLHGNPQTHVMWHRVAPALAEQFTVVAPDLRGYGKTSKPASTPDHSGYSKRTMALDQIDLMRTLGHLRFSVAGHDRGARVGYRLALDHPGSVEKLAALDIIPTQVIEFDAESFGLASNNGQMIEEFAAKAKAAQQFRDLALTLTHRKELKEERKPSALAPLLEKFKLKR